MSKKVGCSVVRHRVKRLVKESYRLHEDGFNSGLDLTVVARRQAAESDYHEIESALLYLMKKAGLLKKAGDSAFVQAETSITGTPDATRLALRGMHRQMSKLATPALDLPVEQRNFSGVTMGVSRESYERIVKVLDECRRQIIAIAADDKNIDQVYRLNLQLFPLTKNVKECENE